MKYFKLISLLCLSCTNYAWADIDYATLLEAQFLDLKQEVAISKVNGEKLDVIYQEEAQQKEWYETMIALDTRSIGQSWINISNGSEILPNQFQHGFYVSHPCPFIGNKITIFLCCTQAMNLSRPVPFFGRWIDNVVLTTGGGLLFPEEEADNSLMIPSFIAPFLTTNPPSDSDSVIFYDALDQAESNLVIQWDRHFNNGEDNRLKMQLRLLLDGSMTFVYQNFASTVLETLASKNYSVLIGLKDGFSAPVPGKPQGIHFDEIIQILLKIAKK